MTPARTTLFRRAVGLGLGALVGFGALLGAAAPANAVGENITLDGTAFINGDSPKQISGDLVVSLYRQQSNGAPVFVDDTTTSIFDGSYYFFGLDEGQYDIVFSSDDELYPATPHTEYNVGLLSDHTLDEVILDALPALGGGDIVVTGNPVVGETLTATVAPVTGANGQAVNAALDLTWGYGRGQSGDSIDGATGLTLVVPEVAVGGTIGYSGYAEANGYRPTLLRSNGLLVTAPIKSASPAPVANSSDLAGFFEANFVEPIPAAQAGLSASVSPSQSQVATIEWYGGDSYVDVYAYSTPRFVGSFPVVNGQVQLTLTPAVLSALGAGSHTLVYTGQSSGSVQAVVFSISPALASTGFDGALPLGIAGVFVLMGAGLLIVTRRRKAAHRV